MTRFHGNKKVPILFIPFILVWIAAASPDPRLLSLVPPGAQLVAGISASSIQDQPDNFVLMTQNNRVDLQDFFALIGADSSRTIHQVVFVAVANNDGKLNEHSLLVSGHFDQPHVFKSAADGGVAVTDYRRIPVLEIQPFARERGMFKFNDVRWLAVLDSNVLVFGSVASTRLELDRYLAHNQPDESLIRRLAHLRSKDQTWCLLSASIRTLSSPARDQEIHRALAELNPKLAELAQSGNELEFGMHYGRRVEFEYEMAMGQGDRSGRLSLRSSSHESPNKTSLLPDLDIAEDANTLHGVIGISVSRYKEWLAEIKRAKLPLD